MSLLPQSARAFIDGPDASLRDALARLITLEPSLKTLSIGDLVALCESPVSLEYTPRHLTPVPNSRDMRIVLSDRELQVVRLVAEGLSNKQISLRLALSDKTVKNHISHILAKLHLTARTQIAVHALRAGIA